MPASKDTVMQIGQTRSFGICASLAVLVGSSIWLASCQRSELPPGPSTSMAAPHVVALPKDDVLDSMKGKRSLALPASPWRQEESQLFTDLLKAHTTEVLVIPFEVQDRGFDRIERSLMTADFAHALSRQSQTSVLNTYLVARALGEGQRRYQWIDVVHLADAVKARVLVRGYVGHDGHGKLTLTLTVQRRASADSPWNLGNAAHHDWTGLPFSNENLPSKVVHGLQSEMLSFVGLTSVGSETSQLLTTSGELHGSWPLPETPSDLVAAQSRDPVNAAGRFAVLAALAPMNPERARERLAERGLLLLEEAPEYSAETHFLRSYFLHLLHRRPAALAALGDAENPATFGLRAVLDGNLDRLQVAVAQSPPSLEALLLEFELCYLKLEYGGSCEHTPLTEVSSVARRSSGWKTLTSGRLTDVLIWEAGSNSEVKSLLDDGFPIPNYSLRDIARTAIVVGGASGESATIDLSVIRHVRKILASDHTLPIDTSELPNRLDYLQLLEGLGESNLLKTVTRTGIAQGFTNDALRQVRTYEAVYAGHPAFAELHARLLQNILSATPDQPSAAISQELEQLSLLAAYLEQGQTAISANVLMNRGRSFSALDILTDAYVQDFPIRAWWQPSDTRNPLPQLSSYLDSRDRGVTLLAALEYAETEVPAFYAERPFLPPEDLRKLFEQRFRGNPNAAKILASIGTDAAQTDPSVAYREAIRRNPATWSNYSDLGDSLLQRGDSEGAARAYLSYPGFRNRVSNAGDAVANSNYAFDAGSGLYWRGAFESARKLYQIAASDNDGSYASIASIGRLALLRGDLIGHLKASLEAAQRYQGPYAYRDYLSILHTFGLHKEAWSGFNALAERFQEPEVWVSAFVGQRMAGINSEQLKQWLLSEPIKQAHFLGRNFTVDYAILWNSIDREPPSDLPQLLDEIQGASKAAVETDGLSTSRPSWRVEGAMDLLPPSDFRRASRSRAPVGSVVRSERTQFADAYVDLRAGRYADAVRKFDELAAHYPIDSAPERYVVPYFAYASAKAGDPLHLEEYLRSARVGGDFAAFLAEAFFEGLHGRKSKALDSLKAAFYNRPFVETDPIFSEYRYAEACEWLYNDTHEDAYRQRALEWARIQERVRPHLAWIYAIEARLLAPGPERTRSLAMTLYLDPQAKVIASLSPKEKSELTQWLDKNNPFTHQRQRQIATPTSTTRAVPAHGTHSLLAQSTQEGL